jgi:hypothetical protein
MGLLGTQMDTGFLEVYMEPFGHADIGAGS